MVVGIVLVDSAVFRLPALALVQRGSRECIEYYLVLNLEFFIYSCIQFTSAVQMQTNANNNTVQTQHNTKSQGVCW